MAPEIYLKQHVSCNADVYSFGCILIEIMLEKKIEVEFVDNKYYKPVNYEEITEGKK